MRIRGILGLYKKSDCLYWELEENGKCYMFGKSKCNKCRKYNKSKLSERVILKDISDKNTRG